MSNKEVLISYLNKMYNILASRSDKHYLDLYLFCKEYRNAIDDLVIYLYNHEELAPDLKIMLIKVILPNLINRPLFKINWDYVDFGNLTRLAEEVLVIVNK